jgi:hypothetical protein
LSSSRAVGFLRDLADFEAAVERSRGTGRMLVVKFYAPTCRSCFNMKPLYERDAEGVLGKQHADFYEVDTTVSRVLCALANIQKMPLIHVYACDGGSCELKVAEIVPSTSKYEDFVLKLARLSDVSPAMLTSGEIGTSVGNVGVVSSSREDPPLAKGQLLVVTKQEQNKFTVAVFDKEHAEAAHTLGGALKAAHDGENDEFSVESARAADEARSAIIVEATLTRSAIVMCCRGWRNLLG